MSARAPGKVAYHHGHLREALLRAALARLDKAVQPKLSLRELARDTGVTVNAAYRHFADKDALLDAVAAEGFRRLATSERDIAGGDATRRERGLALGRAYIAFARAQPALFRLMFTRSSQSTGDAELAVAARSAFQPLLEVTADTLSLPVDDRRCMGGALSAWALVHGLSLLLLDRQINRLVDEPEAFAETALQAMRLDPAALAFPD